MTPEISVIIPAYLALPTIEGCLQSLTEQNHRDTFEVIVVESSGDGTAELVETRFPEFRVIRSHERLFAGSARNRGITESRGRIIAFLDADCEAGTGWVEALLEAHQGPEPAIGGAIANAEPSTKVGWAYFFLEFSEWMPGLPARMMTSVPGAAASYKRTLFESFDPFIGGTYGSDIELHWRLCRAGIALRFEPSIRVAHRFEGSIADFARHELDHAIQFSRMRAKALRFCLFKRSLIAAAAPIVPAKMFALIASRVVRSGLYLRPFVGSVLPLVIGLTYWAAGDLFGNLVRSPELHHGCE